MPYQPHVGVMSVKTVVQTTLKSYLHWFWELRDTSYLLLRFMTNFGLGDNLRDLMSTYSSREKNEPNRRVTWSRTGTRMKPAVGGPTKHIIVLLTFRPNSWSNWRPV